MGTETLKVMKLLRSSKSMIILVKPKSRDSGFHPHTKSFFTRMLRKSVGGKQI